MNNDIPEAPVEKKPSKKKNTSKKKNDEQLQMQLDTAAVNKNASKPQKLSDVFPALKKDGFEDKSDEEKLRICLNECFYPWKQKDFDKGDLTKDICLRPQFVEKIKWVNDEYVGDTEICKGVTIKQWAAVLTKYLINPTDEDRDVLIKLLSE